MDTNFQLEMRQMLSADKINIFLKEEFNIFL